MEMNVLSAVETTAQVAAEAATQATKSIGISVDGFLASLPIMGKGMLGIFIVMAIIILCVTLLNSFTSPDRKDKQQSKRIAKTEKRAEKLKSKENKED